MRSTTIDFSDAIDALVEKHGTDWVAARIRESGACAGANPMDIEIAQHEGAWDREGRRAAESLIIDLHEREFGPFVAPKPPAIEPIKLRDCKRTGLTMGGTGVAPIRRRNCRATMPVREAMIAAGGSWDEQEDDRITVTLGPTLPSGIVAGVQPTTGSTMLRMEYEPDWSEYATGVYSDRWTQLDWTPCPKCGAPLVWYEAGYVPGYRVCAKKPHHHWQA